MSVSKYPVQVGDEEGIVDAVNYALSGPAGLGQNFAGFSTYAPAYLRPSSRQPFVTPDNIPIKFFYSISNAEPCDINGVPVAPNSLAEYVKFTYTTPFVGDIPFTYGQTIDVINVVDGGLPNGVNAAFSLSGTRVATVATQSYQMYPATVTGTGFGAFVNVDLLADPGGPYTTSNTEVNVLGLYPGYGYNIGDTLLITGDLLGGTTPANDLTLTVTATDSGFFNGVYKVWSGTLNDVILGPTTQFYNWPNYIAPNGDIGVDYSNLLLSTDCNGRVNVTGGTDRVFVSGQLILDTTYDCTVPSEFDIVITIDRLTGYISTTPGDNDYVFGRPITTVAERTYHYNIAGAGSITDLETIFTQFIDGPEIPFGYYWYILEFQFVTRPTYVTVNTGSVFKYSVSGTSVSQTVNYPGIVPTTVTGIGAGFNVDIDIDTSSSTDYRNCATITVNNAGSGYVVGDILSVPGTSLGGISPANDLTFTITQIEYPGDAKLGPVLLKLRSLTAQVVKQ